MTLLWLWILLAAFAWWLGVMASAVRADLALLDRTRSAFSED